MLPISTLWTFFETGWLLPQRWLTRDLSKRIVGDHDPKMYLLSLRAIACAGVCIPWITVAATYGPAAPNHDRPALLGWLRQEDYPAESLSAREAGEVTAEFDVTANGAAENCRVLRSSGHLRLDDATCDLIEARARYRPAADPSGKPVASSDVRAFRWILPPKGLGALGIVTDGGGAR